jgi:hypothetical protein
LGEKNPIDLDFLFFGAVIGSFSEYFHLI